MSRLCLPVLLLAACALRAEAQHGFTLSGSVVDPTGAAVPGDTLLLKITG